jgi:hypothetical protein
MFLKRRHGRTHALTGLAHLCLLTISFCEAFFVHAEAGNQLVCMAITPAFCGVFLLSTALNLLLTDYCFVLMCLPLFFFSSSLLLLFASSCWIASWEAAAPS